MEARTAFFVCLSLLLMTGREETLTASTNTQYLSGRTAIVANYGRLPLAFEANQGQTDAQVKFTSRGSGYNLNLTADEAVLTLHELPKTQAQLSSARILQRRDPATVLRMKLVGANLNAKIVGQDELPGKSNYFIGNDPKKWRTNVRQFAKVRYEGIYPGVDLVYYGNQHELEYDLVVQPGANPQVIQLGINGATKLKLDEGDVVLNSQAGDVRLRSPHAYQETNGERVVIPTRYVLQANNKVGFELGVYDQKRPLVIDPVLAYSTYLGGSGDEWPVAIAVDAAGNAYVTGGTSSNDFPTMAPFQSNFHGGVGDSFGEGDVFISKINPAGTALIYSTYLGGSADEVGQAIAVDSTGIYLTGFTGSSDFPTVNPVQATHQGWRNAFVTKINAAGDALVYSTFLGGGEDYGWGIAVDASGRAHVRGDTRSRNFPVVNAIQPVLRSHYLFNCFVSEFTADGTQLLYSTYWGGSGGEGGVGIAVDSKGNTLIGGYTLSQDFPTVNPIQPTLAGGLDAYITKFSADGQTVIYSTFLGGSGDEGTQGFTLESSDNAYIVGYTDSTDFPTVNALQPAYAGGTDAFLAKINSQGNALVYSTYLGGTGQDYATGIAIDGSGNAYVAGHTLSADFPTADPIQAVNHGGRDAFVSKITADGSKLLYSTYLGGSADEGDVVALRDVNVAVDAAGNAYMVGITRSTDFPVTSDAFQTFLKGGADAFVLKIVSDTTPPAITVTASPRELWPPNGNTVPVRISGRIVDLGSGVKPGSAGYTVSDEYQIIRSGGAVTLDASGNYLLMTLLQASRRGNDLDGRVYTIRVSAKDNAGNRGTASTRVVVPHNH